MATKKDLKVIFDKMVEFGAMPGGYRDPFLACDLVNQDNLFSLQEAYAALLLDMARLVGPEAEKTLISKFPYAFKSTGQP